MATVTGKTSEKIDELLGQTLVGAVLNSEGTLTFTRKNGSTINSGNLGSVVVSAVVNSAKRLILTRKDGTTVDAGSIATPALDAWPVGSVYIGVTSANPSTLLGGGTWTPFAQGRMLVGVNPADSSFDAVLETGGTKSKTVASENLPPHTHSINHDHANVTIPYEWTDDTAFGSGRNRVTDIQNKTGGGGTSASVTVDTPAYAGDSGEGPGTSQPMDVMNPYITTYMWRRTA